MTAVEWLDSMSPWPRDGFGLERMRRLLAALGDPQDAYPAIHVVGTNGKSTATITIEQLLLSEGLSVGSTISPHVAGWSERIRVNGAEADFEKAVGRIRPAAEELGATQFEAVTAAALTAFADAGVDVAVVEAGLGGRHDATNVLRTRVVLLTNVGLEHTDVLGDTVEAIAREKLAVAREDCVVVLPDRTYEHLVPGREIRIGGAREAAEAFLGRPVAVSRARCASRQARGSRRRGPGRRAQSRRCAVPRRAAAGGGLHARRLDPRRQGRREMLRILRRAGSRLVATRSSSSRSLPAADLAEIARAHFDSVEAVDDPVAAVARAHELGGPVLVTGSLYLIGDLVQEERRAAWRA